jgi:hypothetical protein
VKVNAAHFCIVARAARLGPPRRLAGGDRRMKLALAPGALPRAHSGDAHRHQSSAVPSPQHDRLPTAMKTEKPASIAPTATISDFVSIGKNGLRDQIRIGTVVQHPHREMNARRERDARSVDVAGPSSAAALLHSPDCEHHRGACHPQHLPAG